MNLEESGVPPDWLETQRLSAERDALVTERDALLDKLGKRNSRGPVGPLSQKAAVRQAWADAGRRASQRYAELSREIERLDALKHERMIRVMADWIRSRPRAARELMLRLPPAATVLTTGTIEDLEPSTMCSVVYFADDGETVGIIRTPLGVPEGPGKREMFDAPRHVRMTTPDTLTLIPELTVIGTTLVAELLVE